MLHPTKEALVTSLAREPEERSVSAGHEIRDVNFRGILALAAGTVLLVVAVMAGLWILLTSSDAPGSATAAGQLPPAPRLQDAPAADYQQFLVEQDRVQNSYGWVDRQQGVVRI